MKKVKRKLDFGTTESGASGKESVDTQATQTSAEGTDTCDAYDLQPITEYRWQLLKNKSSEVYVKADDDDWTFLKDKAIQDGESLRDILPVCRDIEFTVEVETRTQILPSPMELMKMVFTRLGKK